MLREIVIIISDFIASPLALSRLSFVYRAAVAIAFENF